MLTRPLAVLRLEGAVLFALAAWGFAQTGTSWWWFGGLLLAPDLAMVGYLRGPRLGAATYNAAHTYAAPALLALAIPVWSFALPLALIWVAHIGMDRMLGYGLKLPTEFQDTHLGRVGRAHE
ncbi:DUF4260 domain-containing protein [Rubrivirga sp.]|uniref:DUF4260 domain-containing protein n=1 Tax=Rubrivirga sp. TaxID=1885344 RepID=UPI003C73209D